MNFQIEPSKNALDAHDWASVNWVLGKLRNKKYSDSLINEEVD